MNALDDPTAPGLPEPDPMALQRFWAEALARLEAYLAGEPHAPTASHSN